MTISVFFRSFYITPSLSFSSLSFSNSVFHYNTSVQLGLPLKVKFISSVARVSVSGVMADILRSVWVLNLVWCFVKSLRAISLSPSFLSLSDYLLFWDVGFCAFLESSLFFCQGDEHHCVLRDIQRRWYTFWESTDNCLSGDKWCEEWTYRCALNKGWKGGMENRYHHWVVLWGSLTPLWGENAL